MGSPYITRFHRSEAEMCQAFIAFVHAVDPDILTGYNIANFDVPYLMNRFKPTGGEASRRRTEHADGLQRWSRLRGFACPLMARSFSSKQKGTKQYYMAVIPGRTQFDLLPVVQASLKFESYGLGFVSKEVLGCSKIDLPHYVITTKFATDPHVVEDYCKWDAELCPCIDNKLQLLLGYLQMSVVTGATLSVLVYRGEQQKVIMQLLPEFESRNMILPPQHEKKESGGKFKGAYVLAPKIGYYPDRFAVCLDYTSLYPSIMLQHNVCYTTVILPQDLASSSFSPAQYVVAPDTGAAFLLPAVKKGILPSILDRLLAERRTVKAKMNGCAPDSLQHAIYDRLQLALKVSANSLYGFCGSPTSIIPLIILSSSVTAFGRSLLMKSKDLVEKEKGCTVYYGDSVSADTPVLVKFLTAEGAERIAYRNIENVGDGRWVASSHGQAKEICDAMPGYQVWSDQGWTPIQRVIRHKYGNPLQRVLTHTGVVDVTLDHSLLRPNGTIVTPDELHVGEELMHADLPNCVEMDCDISEDAAYAWGLFYADGPCGILLDAILNTPRHIRLSFWEGYCAGDGGDQDSHGYIRCDHQGKIAAARLFFLAASLDHPVSIHTRIDAPNVYRLTCARNGQRQRKNSDAIKKIQALEPCDDYVYDLETVNHHFAAGVGRLVVHNTDSIMVGVAGVSSVERAFEEGRKLERFLNERMPPKVQFKVEEVMKNPLFIQKKNYACEMYTSPSHKEFHKELLLKGIDSVKRDKLPIVRRVMRQYLVLLLQEGRSMDAYKLVLRTIARIKRGQVDITDIIKSQGLSKPLGEYDVKSPPAHVAAARRAYARDTNYECSANSRIPYVYIQPSCGVTKVGEVTEDPGFVIAHNLPIDYDKYAQDALSAVEKIIKIVHGNEGFQNIARQVASLRPEKSNVAWHMRQQQQSESVGAEFVHEMKCANSGCSTFILRPGVCDACRGGEAHAHLLQKKEARLQQAKEKEAGCWDVCSKCQNGDVETAKLCAARECPNFYARQLASTRRQHIEIEYDLLQ
jgi:DNA polymerase elongation subunit (family B)